MIICRTPLRISFFGGGTDFPEWFNDNPAIIINASINKYTYIILRKIKKIHNYNYRLRYFNEEEAQNVNEIKHGPYREAIKKYKLDKTPLEIIYTADLPAMSGLGSSSSSTTGIINACIAFKNKNISKKRLAKETINLERNLLKESVGIQDQISTSFGGFNIININKSDFIVNPYNNIKNMKILNQSCFLYYTGIQRIASKIEKIKLKLISEKKIFNQLKNISNIAESAKKEFLKKTISIQNIGNLLSEQWEEKKKMHIGTSGSFLDEIYDHVIKQGAYGGKILGAGGGGFFLFICNEKDKKKIQSKLKKNNIIDFKFEFSGSQIIYNGNYSDYS